ncbi:unnamed protein product [Phyllotreta striolata]|uniref:Pyruvate dehydrogenase E1 component subunit alpha n=1 Tax=Phyllotreta striolata TaxID=444603 RepID=A0A9N9XP11_PHYSR|nr:unnamed protein product [Phyllotreta striolata]
MFGYLFLRLKISSGLSRQILNRIIIRNVAYIDTKAKVRGLGKKRDSEDSDKTPESSESNPEATEIGSDNAGAHRIQYTPSFEELSKEKALQYITEMTRIRKLEQQAQQVYLQRKIRGFCHLYIGEEACAVGVKASMRPDDTIITSYRCHAWALLMGESNENVLGELMGKTVGSSRGKGGSMHIYGKNFFGGNGIVGAHVPLGSGIGLAHKYRDKGAVSYTIFGDGATDQGQTFESYNMALLWNLPVVYIVENNRYSMGTAIKRHSANTNYYTRGDLIPGIKVNGMDLESVLDAAKFASEYVRKEKKPMLIQLDTYRYRGHSMSDPGTSYRTKEEVKKVMDEQDCIKNFTKKMIDKQLVTQEEIKAIDDKIKKDVKECLDKCEKAPEPGIDETYKDVYLLYNSKVRMPGMFMLMDHQNVSHLVSKGASEAKPAGAKDKVVAKDKAGKEEKKPEPAKKEENVGKEKTKKIK